MKTSNKIQHEPIPSNFVYPEVKPQDYRFGSNKLSGVPLREDGDWRDYLPPEEDQNRGGVESSACYVEAIQHALAVIQEEQFNIKDKNYSARFNALLSNGTLWGGSPIEGVQSIRHDGLIPEDMMPFVDINSWDEYHSWKGVDESVCRKTGKAWLEEWGVGWDIVFEINESLSSKYRKLREALKFSPIPVSVVGWYKRGDIYVKPEGASDNHLVLVVYLDPDDHPYILDTYYPYVKKLERYYNFDFAMRLEAEKKLTQPEISIFIQILEKMREWAGLLVKEEAKPVVEIKPVIKTKPKPEIVTPKKNKFAWDNQTLARMSVREICDDEGLSVAEKNLICAVIQAESGFKIDAVNKNSDNSVDYGICQLNSYWYIQRMKLVTKEQALGDPEFCVRLMIKRYRKGFLKDWAAFNNNSYKKYL